MALANSSGMIFDSWSPQMILSAIDNGPSPEPLSSASSLAGAVAGSGGWLCGSSSASLLNFAGGTGDDNFEAWIDALDSNLHCSTAGRLQVEMMKKTGTAGAKCLLDDQTSAETADGCTSSPAKSKLRQKNPILQDCDSPSPKKRCGITRTAKDKQSPSKDPQSIAAKNRRERISERLRILQDLVPNGTKVDLVTMLEKAINYVKFLQLQVKVLATDEFWPAQGGIAPDVAQVKKAIDAILSPSRDGNF